MGNRGIIKLSCSCNNGCLFCHAAGQEQQTASPADIKAKIRLAGQMGLDGLLLSGGEPTLFPGLVQLIRFISACGMQAGLITNGRMLAYKDLVNRLTSVGCCTFFISLHSAEAAVHDELTCCPGSWKQVIKGLENLGAARVPLDITVNYVVTSRNTQHLLPLFRLLQSLGIKRIRFTLPERKGRLLKNRKLLPHLGTAAHFINQALQSAGKYDITAGHDGLPCCLINRESRHLRDNLESNRIFYMSEIYESGFFPTRPGKSKKSGVCLFCSLEPLCTGYYDGYRQEEAPPRPVMQPVPDHIPYFLQDEFPITQEPCRKRQSSNRVVPAHRRIVVREQETYKVYAAGDTWFPARQVQRIKNHALYSATEGKELALHRKLRRTTMCRRCNLSCAGIYQIDPEFRFFDFSPAAEEELHRLQGCVLEVGFGNLYLAPWLLDNPAAGIQYYGIDPAGARVTRAQQKYPGKNFFRSTLEEFVFPADFFDAAVLSGSYNHIRDIKAALDNLMKLLKPGGKVLILDNGPRVILKQEPAVLPGKGDKQPAYEHYRNHSHREAAAVLQLAGFSIKTGEEAATGGLWMLVGVIDGTPRTDISCSA